MAAGDGKSPAFGGQLTLVCHQLAAGGALLFSSVPDPKPHGVGRGVQGVGDHFFPGFWGHFGIPFFIVYIWNVHKSGGYNRKKFCAPVHRCPKKLPAPLAPKLAVPYLLLVWVGGGGGAWVWGVGGGPRPATSGP